MLGERDLHFDCQDPDAGIGTTVELGEELQGYIYQVCTIDVLPELEGKDRHELCADFELSELVAFEATLLSRGVSTANDFFSELSGTGLDEFFDMLGQSKGPVKEILQRIVSYYTLEVHRQTEAVEEAKIPGALLRRSTCHTSIGSVGQTIRIFEDYYKNKEHREPSIPGFCAHMAPRLFALAKRVRAARVSKLSGTHAVERQFMLHSFHFIQLGSWCIVDECVAFDADVAAEVNSQLQANDLNEALLPNAGSAANFFEPEELVCRVDVKRVVAFRMFPPSGVYVDIFLYLVSYVTHAGQTITFVKHKEYATAALMLIIMLASLHIVYKAFFRARGFENGLRDIHRRIQKTVNTGIEDAQLYFLLNTSSLMLGAFGSMLAPYRMLCTRELELLSLLNAVCGLLLQVKNLGGKLADTHIGDSQRQFGRTVAASSTRWPWSAAFDMEWSFKQQGSDSEGRTRGCCGFFRLFTAVSTVTAVKAWTCCTIAVQITLNAVFMRLYHPLVSFVLFVPIAVAFTLANKDLLLPSGKTWPAWRWFLTAYLEPGNLLAPFSSSVFGLQQMSFAVDINTGNRPAFLHCFAQAVRMLLVALLMTLDFPDMHMGRSVFEREILKAAFWDPFSCYGIYCMTLLILGTLTLPVYLVITIMLLANNKYFRNGISDEGGNADMNFQEYLVKEVCGRVPGPVAT